MGGGGADCVCWESILPARLRHVSVHVCVSMYVCVCVPPKKREGEGNDRTKERGR